MVLLAASVCTKDGKALISRQFVEMTKSRIEGLISTFPKLISNDKQHTFLETDSVRYVYRPLEKLYLLLITTKASNILEDLQTLRLFARVVPEYGGGMTEKKILENSFQILFAFDEIIALGYAEDVNISQIRTFIEMDSHEEKIFEALRESQEREAKENMKRKAKELQMARLAESKRQHGLSSNSYTPPVQSLIQDRVMESNYLDEDTPKATKIPSFSSSKPVKKGMQLGMKMGTGNVDSFVDQLKSEGEKVLNIPTSVSEVPHNRPAPVQQKPLPESPFLLKIEEKMNISVKRDGSVNNLDLQGILQVQCCDPSLTTSVINIDVQSVTKGTEWRPPATLQTHPNMDKKLFQNNSVLAAKSNGKPYPVDVDVGVLKWRFSTQNEDFVPIFINCWPNMVNGGFEVNMEYELKATDIEFNDLRIEIPIPLGSNLVVGNHDGSYSTDARKTKIIWTIDIVNSEEDTGSLEFTVKGAGLSEDSFFPIGVSFHSQSSYCGIEVHGVKCENAGVKYEQVTSSTIDNYELV